MSGDPQFERLLREALRPSRAGDACPDPERLAAYADGSLPSSDRAKLEVHAADCARCAEHLALLASVEPAAPADAPEHSLIGRWAWLVPVATAVLVFAVWTRTETPVSDRSIPAEAPARSEPETALQREAPPDHPFEPNVDAEGQQAKRQKVDVLRSPASSEMERDTAAPEPEREAESFDDGRRRDRLARTPAAAPVSPTETRDLREEKASKEAAPPAAPVAAESAFALRDRDTMAKASPVVTVGDNVMVRVSATGIERSTDGGKTWTNEITDLSADLTTVACPTRHVCWAGGDGGLVLRREADGVWTRRPLPAASTVVSIDAAGAIQATVTLADGRRLRTVDGGSSWLPAED